MIRQTITGHESPTVGDQEGMSDMDRANRIRTRKWANERLARWPESNEEGWEWRPEWDHDQPDTLSEDDWRRVLTAAQVA